MKFKKGNLVQSKQFPIIKGEIVRFKKDFDGVNDLAILDNGTIYLLDEIELVKDKKNGNG